MYQEGSNALGRRLTGLEGCPQVLDDSTDQKTRDLVDDKCLEWQERGIRCECVRRTNRKGYKAGALKDVISPRSCSLSPCLSRMCTHSLAPS